MTQPIRWRPNHGRLAPAQLDHLFESAALGEAAVWESASLCTAELFGERGSAVVVDDDGSARVVCSTHGTHSGPIPLELARYPEIERALASGRVVVVEDVAADPRLADVRALLPPSLAQVVAVPVAGRTRSLGVLLAQTTTRRTMAPDLHAAAEQLGAVVGHLVEAVRLRATLTGEDTAPKQRVVGPAVLFPVSDEAATHGRAASPRSILIVEDEPAHAEVMASVLRERGHDVVLAADGHRALDEARQRRFDAVLLDVHVPQVDGLEVAERLRDDPRTRSVPILFVSATDDLLVRMRGLQLGAVDFLGKPLFAPELIARIERSADDAAHRAELTHQARVDALTGLANLRALDERLRLEAARAHRYGTALTVVMIDVDGLKRINDAHGHAVGSRVLAAVGRVLHDETRETDIAARYGGDEFMVVLPHAGLEEGRRFAERTLARLKSIELDGVEGLRVSASFGVATGPIAGRRPEELPDALLQRADAAAYRAKRRGGGCVCLALDDVPDIDVSASS